jgi:rRNA processing protein Krr1/Pno1
LIGEATGLLFHDKKKINSDSKKNSPISTKRNNNLLYAICQFFSIPLAIKILQDHKIKVFTIGLCFMIKRVRVISFY